MPKGYTGFSGKDKEPNKVTPDFIRHYFFLNMEALIYLFILSYFLIGALAFAMIGKNKSKAEKKTLWTKYGTYFVIIHLLFLSIYFGPVYFVLLGSGIALAGYIELTTRGHQSFSKPGPFFVLISLVVYTIFVIPFFFFTMLDQQILYFTFIVIAVFDAFSQISGQLLRGKKLLPSISPNKTVSGAAGGAAAAIITAILIKGFIGITWLSALLFAGIIVIFALLGDLLASYYKRQLGIKDFSKLLPGHGGFLDRFDSFIPGGAVMFALNSLFL